MILIILVILVAATILNSYLMRREAIRREYEHERRQERFESLMSLLQKPNSDKKDDPESYRVSDTRDDDKNYQG
jgi:hypothetical protein